MAALACDQSRDCTADVTYIDRKGWIYCTNHGPNRYHGSRKMTAAEVRTLEAGGTIWYDRRDAPA